MNNKTSWHFVIILLLIISIASTNIPSFQGYKPLPEVSWAIGYDEELGKNVFSLKQDSSSRKVYVVGIVAEGDPMTYDQTAFDADLYFDLDKEMWVFSENTWGVTVFHLWHEEEVVKITVNGVSYKDFDLNKREEPTERPDAVVASL